MLERSERTGGLPRIAATNLIQKEGELCAVATANFPKPELIRLQQHTSEFLDIGDHNEVLTRTIENLGGLTEGSYIRDDSASLCLRVAADGD